MLAVRHHLPIVDLHAVGIAVDAAQLIPVQTLERSVAVPYALEGDVLKVAVADPGNLHAIDELRLATKHSLDLGVASRDDILSELQRLLRTAEAIGSVVERRHGRGRRRRRRPRGRRRHLRRPARAPRERAHLPGGGGERLRRPFRGTGGRARGAVPRRRRAPRGAAHPEEDGRRRDDAPQGPREARHRRAPQAAGRPDHALCIVRRAHARHPRRDAADGRGREGRHAPARQVAQAADDAGARARPTRCAPTSRRSSGCRPGR